MIVRRDDAGLLLITQPDHAALARRIMEHWRPLQGHPRRLSILHAIGEHDNGWHELDDHPRIDAAGCVIDFMTAPARWKQDVWPRAIARLEGDPLAAALVAQHAIVVYDRYRGDPEWSAFFPGMERRRDALLPRTNLSLDELRRDYVFVRLGDLISLTFCVAWDEEQSFEGFRVRLEDEAAVAVAPYDFDQPDVAFEIPARLLEESSFGSDAAFRAALAAAPVISVHGVVSGETPSRVRR